MDHMDVRIHLAILKAKEIFVQNLIRVTIHIGPDKLLFVKLAKKLLLKN